mmetsp:Transcript_23146/g.33918  ORF Transcript_23146/g.33918 Transcript_23146/m.33918 type:complete len:596 (+) Transcript_23146:38-1825(+)
MSSVASGFKQISLESDSDSDDNMSPGPLSSNRPAYTRAKSYNHSPSKSPHLRRSDTAPATHIPSSHTNKTNSSNEINEKNQQIEKLSREIKSKMRQISEQTSANMKLHLETKDQRKKIDMLEETIRQLDNNVHRLEGELRNARSKNEVDSEQWYGELRAENAELQRTITKLNAHKESKTLMVDKLSTELKEKRSEVEQMHDLLVQQRRQLSERDQVINKMKEERQSLEINGMLPADRDEILLALRGSVSRLEEELAESVKEVEHQKQMVKDANDKVSSARAETRQCKLEISRLVDELKKAKIDAQKVRKECDVKIADSEIEVDFLRGLLADAEARVARVAGPDVVHLSTALMDAKTHDPQIFELVESLLQRYGLLEGGDPIRTKARGMEPREPVLDIRDIVDLLETGVLSLQYLPREGEEEAANEDKADKPSEPPAFKWDGSGLRRDTNVDKKQPVNRMSDRGTQTMVDGAEAQKESTLRMLDFMDVSQVADIAQYLQETPVLAAPPDDIEDASGSSESPRKRLSTANSNSVNGSLSSPGMDNDECVCFRISRGYGQPEEHWVEFKDKDSGRPYYHNPETGVTQWDMPVQIDYDD